MLPDAPKGQEVGALSRRKAWARLLAKGHELDVMACPRCHKPMKIIAVFTDPAQVERILRHLIKIGRAPPGLLCATPPP